jgi:hypothetical protein
MPATSDRAQYVKQGFRITEVGPVFDVVAKYGDSARKSIEPIATFFETEADAEAIRNERLFLLSRDARLFNHVVAGEALGLGMTYNVAAPQCTVIDDLRTANYPAVVAEIKINFGNQTTDLLTWGGADPDIYRITDVGDFRITSDGDLRIWS